MGDTYEPPKLEESDSEIEIDNYINADPTKRKGWTTKQKLIEICQKSVGTMSSGKPPLNIAVIGPPGCGKSSLLNTIFASFNDDKWRELAAYGKGDGTIQITHQIKSLKKEKYYTRKTEQFEDDEVLMPTFIDVMGLENENNLFNQELLRIIFDGRVEEGESLLNIREGFDSTNIEGFRERYGQREEYLKIDRVICVCSGDPEANFPDQLFKCVNKIANSKRVIPVYGVMTKADLFDGRKNPEVKKREELFCQHLGIPENRFARIINYCANVDEKLTYMYTVIPKLDVKILKLMHQVLSGDLDVSNPDYDHFKDTIEGVVVVPGDLQRNAPSVPAVKGLNYKSLLIVITLQVLLLAILLNFTFKPIITDIEVNKICEEYEYLKATQNINIDGLNKICENRGNVLKPPIMELCVGFIGILFVIPYMVLFLSCK